MEHKTSQESATNVNNHIALVETEIERASGSLLEYKYAIEGLRQELTVMHEKALIENGHIEDNLCPQLVNLEKNLKSVIAQQKDSNAKC